MTEVSPAFIWREARETGAEKRPQRVDRPAAGGAQDRFQFGKAQLNRVEVWTVGWQMPERRAGGGDGLADAGDMMRGEIVGHDDVPRAQRRDEYLRDVGEEAVPLHRPVEDAWGGQPGHAEPRDEGAGLPMAQRRVIGHPLAAQAATIAANQVRRDAGFVEKDEACWVNGRRPGLPLLPRREDIRAGLFGRAYRCF